MFLALGCLRRIEWHWFFYSVAASGASLCGGGLLVDRNGGNHILLAFAMAVRMIDRMIVLGQVAYRLEVALVSMGEGWVSVYLDWAADGLLLRRLVATNVRGIIIAKTRATKAAITKGEKNPEDVEPEDIVNAVVAAAPVKALLALMAYVPAGTDGTVNTTLMRPKPSANAVATMDVSK